MRPYVDLTKMTDTLSIDPEPPGEGFDLSSSICSPDKENEKRIAFQEKASVHHRYQDTVRLSIPVPKNSGRKGKTQRSIPIVSVLKSVAEKAWQTDKYFTIVPAEKTMAVITKVEEFPTKKEDFNAAFPHLYEEKQYADQVRGVIAFATRSSRSIGDIKHDLQNGLMATLQKDNI